MRRDGVRKLKKGLRREVPLSPASSLLHVISDAFVRGQPLRKPTANACADGWSQRLCPEQISAMMARYSARAISLLVTDHRGRVSQCLG